MEIGMRAALAGDMEPNEVVDIINHIFAALFTVELGLRIIAYKLHFFLGEDWQWNCFDAFIVCTTLSDYVLAGIDGFSALRALRALRLAKTLRILRVVTVFRNLQLILNSLMNSLLSLVWMLVLLLLALYLVTIVFMGAAMGHLIDTATEITAGEDNSNVFTTDAMTNKQIREAFEKNFNTIPRGMLSMFFSVTGGVDWYEVLQPLLAVSWLYACVFVAFVIFVVFGVFNVLNAVFVESVLTNRDKDLLIQNEQVKTRIFMRDLADLFNEGDTDGNHSLTYAELEDHCQNDRFIAYLNTYSLDASDTKALFDMLDNDKSGSVDVEEFVLGALKLKGPAKTSDMLKLQIFLNKLQCQADAIQAALKA
jgi:hypothetical protein